MTTVARLPLVSIRSACLIMVLLGQALVHGQSPPLPRVAPASATIFVEEGGLPDATTFTVSNAPANAVITVSISYSGIPEGPPVQGWLDARVSGRTITATAAPGNLPRGKYLASLRVLVNGAATVPSRVGVVLALTPQDKQYRFQNAADNNEIFDPVRLSQNAQSARVLVDYNDIGAASLIRVFRVAPETVDGRSWLKVAPLEGQTGNSARNLIQISADFTGLQVSADPYVGYIQVYEPGNPNNRSVLEVRLTVSSLPCIYTLSPSSASVTALRASGSFVVNTAPTCSWTAAAQDSWITISSGATGIGQGRVIYNYDANQGAARSGRIVAAGQTFTISQVGAVATNPVMSHIAAYGAWSTTIVLVNTDNNASASLLLVFRDDNGLPLTLTLRRLGSTDAPRTDDRLAVTIPPGGSVSYQTVEDSGRNTVTGYAELAVSSPSVRGQAVFRQRDPAGLSFEATVPMERGGRHFSIPFDNAGGYVTTLAIVNTSPTAGDVTITARNGNGQNIGTRSVRLNAGQHVSDAAANLAGSFVSGQRGMLDFDSSNADFAALGFRFSTPFTTLAVISRDAPAAGAVTLGNPLMAQIAAYGGWKTLLILTNTNPTQTLRFTLNLRSGLGAPLVLTLNQLAPLSRVLTNQSVLSDSIPPGGSVIYETIDNAGASLTQGFAELVAGGESIRGQAIFQQKNANLAYEAAVSMTSGNLNFLLPFDNSGYVTSLAIVNPGTSAANFTVSFRDEQGTSLMPSQNRSMGAGNQIADSSVRMFGSGLDGKRGVIEFKSDAPLGALGLRFSIPFTSFAIIPK